MELEVAVEHWPIAGTFTIARGSKREATVVVATIRDGAIAGRGECVPYSRYGETIDGVAADIRRQAGAVAAGMTRSELQSRMPAGAARNALDCALWDLEAKRSGRTAASAAGFSSLRPLETAFTLSLAAPEAMAEAARAAAMRPLLKVKLGGDGDPARIAAVRAAAPACRLIVDANESWRPETLAENIDACQAAGVRLIEQPLPAASDRALDGADRRGMLICADESLHTSADLPGLAGRYDAVNIKLDKAGGLTAALALAREAEALGITLMVGCMVATSLAMAPAFLVAQMAAFVDLDGALLLAEDREPGLIYEGSIILPPDRALWG
jgi:L-alanine-DL-glutamate epimerase-like enolase superfamily enzyme